MTAPSSIETRRPVRRMEWKRRDDGGVDVLRPKFGTGRVGRYLSSRMRRPDVTIRLDETGSFVWLHCDGKRTVADIARALEQRDGPADDLRSRLTTFLVGMLRRGMIGWD